MGVISKQLNRSRTARLVAPVRATTSLNAAAVFRIAGKVVDAYVPHTGFATLQRADPTSQRL
jgi:hypothetical protein